MGLGDGGGAYNAREGHHSKAAVLELSQLKTGAISALAEAKRVEAEVSRLAARALFWLFLQEAESLKVSVSSVAQ